MQPIPRREFQRSESRTPPGESPDGVSGCTDVARLFHDFVVGVDRFPARLRLLGRAGSRLALRRG